MSDAVYIFNADLLCEDCGIKAVERHIRERSKVRNHPQMVIDCRGCGFKGPIGRDAALMAFRGRNAGQWLKCPKCSRQSATFDEEDSDFFPIYRDEPSESDRVQHCGAHDRCVNADTFEGVKVGKCLENPLTSEGVRWLFGVLEEQEASDYQRALYERWREVYRYELRDFSESTDRAADYPNDGGRES